MLGKNADACKEKPEKKNTVKQQASWGQIRSDRSISEIYYTNMEGKLTYTLETKYACRMKQNAPQKMENMKGK